MTAAPKPDPTGVAAAWSRVIELSDAGSPPAKRAAARAHAEALTRRWKLSLGEQAAQGREIDAGSTPLKVVAARPLRQMNGNGTHG